MHRLLAEIHVTIRPSFEAVAHMLRIRKIGSELHVRPADHVRELRQDLPARLVLHIPILIVHPLMITLLAEPREVDRQHAARLDARALADHLARDRTQGQSLPRKAVGRGMRGIGAEAALMREDSVAEHRHETVKRDAHVIRRA